MAALILLSDYYMKKAIKRKHPLSESEIPLDLHTFREFQAEFRARTSGHDRMLEAFEARFTSHDEKFASINKLFESIDRRFDAVDRRFEAMEKKFDAIDARFDAVDARFDEMDKKFESLREEMRGHFHQIKLLLEEQNLRNRQAYDGYLTVYEKTDSLEKRLRPECFKD